MILISSTYCASSTQFPDIALDIKLVVLPKEKNARAKRLINYTQYKWELKSGQKFNIGQQTNLNIPHLYGKVRVMGADELIKKGQI